MFWRNTHHCASGSTINKAKLCQIGCYSRSTHGKSHALHKPGLGYKAASKRLCLPHSTVQYTVKKGKLWGTVKNLNRSGRKRKISLKLERNMIRNITTNPRTSVQDIKAHLVTMGVDVSNSTIEWCPYRAGLKSCRPRKTPLRKKCHLNARLKFPKEHVKKPDKFWDKVLWSDETKVELYGHNDLKTVWRKKGEAYHPKNTIPTVRHGGGNLMLWGCFSSNGVGKRVRVHGIMKKEDYKKILEENVHEPARKLSLGRNFVFQQDNDPKHASKLVKKWFQDKKLNVLERPSHSPDLNLIDNLWWELKVWVWAREPKTLDELEQNCQDEWSKIPVEICKNLICYYKKRLLSVITKKSHAIDYWTKGPNTFELLTWDHNTFFDRTIKSNFLVSGKQTSNNFLKSYSL